MHSSALKLRGSAQACKLQRLSADSGRSRLDRPAPPRGLGCRGAAGGRSAACRSGPVCQGTAAVGPASRADNPSQLCDVEERAVPSVLGEAVCSAVDEALRFLWCKQEACRKQARSTAGLHTLQHECCTAIWLTFVHTGHWEGGLARQCGSGGVPGTGWWWQKRWQVWGLLALRCKIAFSLRCSAWARLWA